MSSENKVRVGLIGLGKMGISHCAILNSHRDVDLVGVCDTSKFLRWTFDKYSTLRMFNNYKSMIKEVKPDCVFVATPTKYHFEITKYCLENGMHVFLEKPCCLNYSDTRVLQELADQRRLLVQVGYHNRYLGTFNAVKKMVDDGELGRIYHFNAEAYGPVVVNKSADTWRSNRAEGGGCLYDYASHVINLVQYVIGEVECVSGTCLRRVFSENVEDAVYSTLWLDKGRSGQLSVSWSEESYRKMSTSLVINGDKGRVEANAQEIKIYRNRGSIGGERAIGWEFKYLTDCTAPVEFYLRGEEYTAQVYDFIAHIRKGDYVNRNAIKYAGETDRVVEMLIEDDQQRPVSCNG